MIASISSARNGSFLRLFRRHTSSHTFFDKFSKGWWDIDGDMSILHDYNQVRIPFIARSYLSRNSDSAKANSSASSDHGDHLAFKQLGIFKEPYKRSSVHVEAVLKGLDILDVGCGGGILTESLAKFGCNVLGIDPNEKLIEVARSHKRDFFDNIHIELGLRDDNSRNLEYRTTSVYDLCEDKGRLYDIVVASEVIEHIDNREKERFFEALTSLVKPGGVLVITTPGSSLSSFLVNIVLAENVFNRVPKHTHDFNLFITPKNCCKILSKLDFEPVLKQGLLYLPYLRRFFHTDSCDLLYMYSFTHRNGVERVFPENMEIGSPECLICGSALQFLVQLAISNSHDRNRVVFIYYCPKDVTNDGGWALFRFSVERKTAEPSFSEMGEISSWIDGINLSFTDTDMSNNGLRVILENDYVQDDYDVHSIVLLEKYKTRPRDEIDEEDHADFDAIDYTQEPPDSEGDDWDEEESEVDEEVEAINRFHTYLSSRQNVLLRVNRGGTPISFLPDNKFAGNCQACNAPCTFELQLLPLVAKHISTHNSSSGPAESASVLDKDKIAMTLGGVVFYTCGSDCPTGGSPVRGHSHVLLYQ